VNADDRLDGMIDDVARRMTEGAPASELAARVLQRIDERQQPSRRRRMAWVAVPIAAAAVALIALQVARLKPDVASVPTGSRSNLPSAVAPAPEPAGLPERNGADVRSVDRLRPDSADTMADSSVDALAPPPLDAPRLDVEPLDAGITTPDPLDLEHLEDVAPIAVTPLGVDDPQRQ
jgi:hypothetical protein